MFTIRSVELYKYFHKHVYVCVIDPQHVPVYNVTVSNSMTLADLSGFDITISWTLSEL